MTIQREGAWLASHPARLTLAIAAALVAPARATPVAVTPGQEVIRQGDHGDRFYG